MKLSKTEADILRQLELHGMFSAMVFEKRAYAAARKLAAQAEKLGINVASKVSMFQGQTMIILTKVR